jgi:hypothetical protein
MPCRVMRDDVRVANQYRSHTATFLAGLLFRLLLKLLLNLHRGFHGDFGTDAIWVANRYRYASRHGKG